MKNDKNIEFNFHEISFILPTHQFLTLLCICRSNCTLVRLSQLVNFTFGVKSSTVTSPQKGA